MVPSDDQDLSQERQDFLQPLLAPISPDSPTGEDVRAGGAASKLYFAIRSKRNDARNAERKLQVYYGPPEDAPAPPDWRPVYENAPKLLISHSKDLEVVACYIDALVRRRGFDGLRDGLRLAWRLVALYWDQLYPIPDKDELDTLENKRRNLVDQYPEDELTAQTKYEVLRNAAYTQERIQPLRGMLGVLSADVKAIPITEGHSRAGYNLTESQAAAKNGIPDVNDASIQARREKGELFLDTWQDDAKKSRADFWKRRYTEIDDCLTELAYLSDVLIEKLGGDAPSTFDARETLEACRDVAKKFASSSADPATTAETPQDPAGAATGAAPVLAGVTAPPVDRRGREALFKQLLEIADHFERTEPHSPISFHLRRAVRWGGMKLPDLLDEIVANDDARKHLYELIGIHRIGGE